MFTAKVGFTVFVAAMLGIFAFCFWPSTNNSPSLKTPMNLSGSWHESSNDSPVSMSAEVTDGHIQIFMSSDLANGILYWDGTFDVKNDSPNSFNVVSTVDEHGLSQDSVKTFTYKNGELTYPFSMMGKSYMIRLIRGE